MEITDIFDFIGVNEKFLEMPYLILNVTAMVLFFFSIKSLLEKLRIFRSPTTNIGISVIMTFFSIPLMTYGSSIVGGSALLFVCMMNIRGIKGILIGGILGGFFIFILTPILYSLRF